MKTMHFLYSFAIFLAFLLAGYQTGASLGATGRLRPGPQASASLSFPHPPGSAAAVLPNGQHSILLIGVDDLKSRTPRLESIWIMSYVANSTRLTFLPVYPGLSEPSRLPGLFRFTTSAGRTQLDPAFRDSLREQVPWWGSFLLLDRVSLSEWLNDVPGRKELPHAWEDPRAALLGQADLYQEMCWNPSRSEYGPDLGEVAQRLPGHVLSNLDRSQLSGEINAVSEQMGRFSCEFPTLAVP